jgi:hypothetical protein
MLRFSIGILCVLQAVNGAIVCSRGNVGPTPVASFAPGIYYYWTCDKNPYATKMWYQLVNPDGFKLRVTLTDGINDCNSNDSSVGAKPEVSYPPLGLTNVSMWNGSCNQVPCCLKVACDRSNSRNCTSVALQFRFSNDLNEDSSSHNVDEDGIQKTMELYQNNQPSLKNKLSRRFCLDLF